MILYIQNWKITHIRSKTDSLNSDVSIFKAFSWQIRFLPIRILSISSAVLMSLSLGLFPHPCFGFVRFLVELRIIAYISEMSKSFDEVGLLVLISVSTQRTKYALFLRKSMALPLFFFKYTSSQNKNL